MYKIYALLWLILSLIPVSQLNAQQTLNTDKTKAHSQSTIEIQLLPVGPFRKTSPAYDMLNRLISQYEIIPYSSALVMLNWMLFKYEIIHFETASHRLSAAVKKILKRKAHWIKDQDPNIQLKVIGHCDQRGSYDYNKYLGVLRANAVKQFLINYGLPHDKVQIISAGDTQPLDQAENEIAWAKNRRVEVVSDE